MQRRINSKWKKMIAMRKNPLLARHIPKTTKLTKSNLKSMLESFGMVYLKPDEGTFGIGVIRIEQIRTKYRLRTGVRVWTYTSFPILYKDIVRRTGRKPYLVQQGIELLKYRGRRFDLRVMVQENPSGRMECTGIIGRVAHPKKIITNYHGGGQLKPVATLLAPYVPKRQMKGYVRKLKRLGFYTGQSLREQFPGVKETGVDIAVDRRLYPWILEANTRPDPAIFKFLNDKKVYRKIVRYARRYGRFSLKPMKLP